MSDSTDIRDPLEIELEALRPMDLSAGTFDRVGSALMQPRRRRWLIPTTAAAASVVLAIMWRMSIREIPLPPTPIAATWPAAATNEQGDESPALSVYRRALTGPPDALDKLLDRHADRVLPGGTRVTASSSPKLFP